MESNEHNRGRCARRVPSHPVNVCSPPAADGISSAASSALVAMVGESDGERAPVLAARTAAGYVRVGLWLSHD